MTENFRNILISYANSYGGGLPLTPEEICNATVLYVDNKVKDLDNLMTNIRNEFDTLRRELVEYIGNLIGGGNIEDILRSVIVYGNTIEGSDTVVVDVNEAGTALEIHLDAEVVAQLGRAVKTPLANPQSPEVPVLNPNGTITWEGQSGKLYAHYVEGTCTPDFLIPGVEKFRLSFLSTSNENTMSVTDFNNFIASKYNGELVVNDIVHEEAFYIQFNSSHADGKLYLLDVPSYYEYPIMKITNTKIYYYNNKVNAEGNSEILTITRHEVREL